MSRLALIATFGVALGQRDQLIKSLIAHKSSLSQRGAWKPAVRDLALHDDDTKVLRYEVYRADARHSTCIAADHRSPGFVKRLPGSHRS